VPVPDGIIEFINLRLGLRGPLLKAEDCAFGWDNGDKTGSELARLVLAAPTATLLTGTVSLLGLSNIYYPGCPMSRSITDRPERFSCMACIHFWLKSRHWQILLLALADRSRSHSLIGPARLACCHAADRRGPCGQQLSMICSVPSLIGGGSVSGVLPPPSVSTLASKGTRCFVQTCC
jgi:hypothetical protein